MEPLTIGILAGIGGLLFGGGAAAIHGNNKLNKERAQHQEERDRLQRQIEELLQKITEKDQIILQLQQRIKQLDEEKLAETQKRNQLLKMIEVMEQRQEQLESLLTGLMAFITFRFGKWKRDKIELREQLLAAHNDRDTVDNLLACVEEKKISLEGEFSSENLQREELYAERQRLTDEFEQLGA